MAGCRRLGRVRVPDGQPNQANLTQLKQLMTWEQKRRIAAAQLNEKEKKGRVKRK